MRGVLEMWAQAWEYEEACRVVEDVEKLEQLYRIRRKGPTYVALKHDEQGQPVVKEGDVIEAIPRKELEMERVREMVDSYRNATMKRRKAFLQQVGAMQIPGSNQWMWTENATRDTETLTPNEFNLSLSNQSRMVVALVLPV